MKTLNRFLVSCEAENIGEKRRKKYQQELSRLEQVLEKELLDITEEDVAKFLSWLNQTGYSEYTKSDYKVALKKYSRWLYDDDLPRHVRRISTKVKAKDRKIHSNLLTEADLQRLLLFADSPKLKAMTHLFWESGARNTEIRLLKIKDIEFQGKAALISIKHSKSMPRRIPVVGSVPTLLVWLERHPYPEPDCWLFPTPEGEPMKDSSVLRALSRLGKRAGLQKKTNPHAFRHARATILFGKWSEQKVKAYMGWTPESRMASVYCHIRPEDLIDDVVKL